MKKILSYIMVTCLAAMAGTSTSAAQGDNAGDLQLMIAIPTQADGLPAGAESALRNKLTQLTANTGLGTLSDYAQFAILVNVQLDTKDIVGGAPPKIAQTTVFNFYLVDQINENVYATTSVRAKGVGNNETKAYLASIKQLNVNSPELKSFVDNGKKKIIDYYNANCDKIIRQAMTSAGMKQYADAMFYLSQIPDVCTDCYAKATKASLTVYQQYIDELCVRNLAKAKAAWAAEQNSYGAEEAGEYLSQIYPDAKCYKEAQTLYAEIKKKVLDDWKFEMKQYQDGVDIEKQKINAIREIGVAYGKNQKPVTYAPAYIVR